MQRFVRVWPVTCNHIKRQLAAAGLTVQSVEVVWTQHRTGRIKFSIRLPMKYALFPDAERKWRTIAAFSDRVIDCRTRQNQRWVALSFVLDCAAWVND